ncbi:CvfB family protein [Texcoconibacillus texcoconensis]|uniref:S1 motif domain-containing protein n=1 Tax=Texcoconibacillus texcoconensis TaxID=1095777 RepID=A0A840QQX4_9BACI|nr:S1-like domain-containing RNA-binding protein [Texcoconibacillus texcoconensis]MBB5173749.1 hypothetical protein [Texcoconibacillus texcoconensis]
MSYLKAGYIENLTVARKIETGYVLTDGKQEVLLHMNEASKELADQEAVDVFLYQDKKGQLVATMALPELEIGTYDWVKVVDKVKNLGVFVDIGIQKHILVSKDELPLLEKVWPDQGDELFVTLTLDKKGRLLAKPVTEDIVVDESDKAPDTLKNETIGGQVYRTTKIGTFILTEEGYRGFIHQSERKEEPRLGQWVEGRVIEVKENGTLNVSLRPLKQEGMKEDAEAILEYLEEHQGEMPFSDKSDPDSIRDTFKLSKAAFKRALGKLMKEGKIEQRGGKTFLKSK